MAGTPLLWALSLSPILSIHVPQLKRFPPKTKPVSGLTLTCTLNPMGLDDGLRQTIEEYKRNRAADDPE